MTCARSSGGPGPRAPRPGALAGNPFIRGTAQNPDVYFQARETVDPISTPSCRTRSRKPWTRWPRGPAAIPDHGIHRHPEAERVIVVMGSAAQTTAETVAHLCAQGERVGVLQVRLFRPFPARALLDALPASVRRVAVLDRTKEPGSSGEPLFLDVVSALAEAYTGGERAVLPLVTGGRYGLSSKELTPGMVAGVFAELAREQPRSRFTIGIDDDVFGLSLPYDPSSTSNRRTSSARSSTVSARTEPSARTRTRSRSWAPGTCAPKDTSSTTQRSPARRPCRTCVSGGSRSARRTSSAGELRRLSSVRAPGPGRRARPGGARSEAAAQLLAAAG